MTPTKFRFTQRNLDQLVAQRSDAASKAAEYSDAEVVGLRLLVSKTGRKVFYFRFTLHGQKRAARIGEYPAISIQDARRRALEMRADVDRDADPTEDKRRIRATPFFEDFANNDYLTYARQHKRSHRDDESKLRLHLVPKFGRFKLCDITTRDIQSYHASVRQSHCAATANRHLSVLSALFRCAKQWGIVESNPCSGVSAFKENNQRQRFLTVDEITRMLTAMEAENNKTAVALLKLLLLTGTRRDEGSKARWEHIDLERGTWLIPNPKNGKARYVTLNEEALRLLAEVPKTEDCPWVFPGRDPSKPINNPRKAFHRILAAAIIEPLRIHDLRHTFASVCVNSGVSLFAVQQLLGHANSSTTARYAHLAADSLRQASQSVSKMVSDASRSTSEVPGAPT